MNIYGDMKVCSVPNCDNKADVVENHRDYCAECWWKRFSGTKTSLKKYEKNMVNEKELIDEKTRQEDIKRFKEI